MASTNSLDLKDKLILIFFNNFRSNYSMNDLIRLLSLSSSLLSKRIDKLIEDDLLNVDDFAIIRLNEQGEVVLRENNLFNIDLPEMLLDIEREENTSTEVKFVPQKIYIPSNFEKKYML